MVIYIFTLKFFKCIFFKSLPVVLCRREKNIFGENIWHNLITVRENVTFWKCYFRINVGNPKLTLTGQMSTSSSLYNSLLQDIRFFKSFPHITKQNVDIIEQESSKLEG